MDMKENNLEALLQKYTDGDTSLGEESALREHFSRADVHSSAGRWFRDQQQFREERSAISFEMFMAKQGIATALKRRYIWWAAAASVLIAVLALFYDSYNADAVRWLVVQTSDAQQFLTLPDGSAVLMNVNSKLSYPDRWDGRRELTLEAGEAFFDVVRDTLRPFIVHAPGGRVEVLGTSFNINTYRKEVMELMVVSGSVSFAFDTLAGQQIIVNAGDGGVLDLAHRTVSNVGSFDVNRLAWRTHRLEFKDAPLSQVVLTLREYFKVDLSLVDDRLANCRFRGSFDAASLDEVFQVMEFTLNVKVITTNGAYVISGTGCKN